MALSFLLPLMKTQAILTNLWLKFKIPKLENGRTHICTHILPQEGNMHSEIATKSRKGDINVPV